MPDKPLTVLTYAASASLAAVALVYFFNPNYLIDGDSSHSAASARKRGVVGLFNPANDCFINCVLQSLAGLGDLRLFLIRETHRRELNPEVYENISVKDEKGKGESLVKSARLQTGEVTKGLKEMIDKLNERPLYRKTISASSFIRVLEQAFETRIAKSQQDAQEMLQIVAERLSEEYHAGKEARRKAAARLTRATENRSQKDDFDKRSIPDIEVSYQDPNVSTKRDDVPREDEDGFPLEGQTETRIECQFCHFVPKSKPTSFVMLTLSVPQKSSTSLNECFDGQFKTEFIEDYKCDRCRLVHAADNLERELKRVTSEEKEMSIRMDLWKIKKAIQEDPEKIPEGVTLPDIKHAPKRKIGRHTDITRFPKILIIHLSRSIYDPRSSSTKNMSRVAFPERFPVGSLLRRQNYKLLGVVSHKGTHNSGHYENFRRQHSYAPYSTPHNDRSCGPYGSLTASVHSASATVGPLTKPDLADQKTNHTVSTADSTTSAFSFLPSQKSESESPPSSRPSSGSTNAAVQAKAPANISAEKPPVLSSQAAPSASTIAKSQSPETSRFKRRRRPVDRWWRISDDKIKECKTNDVLNMQREVYMLFYEVEKDDSVR